MSINELKRIKADLEVIKKAARLEISFGWNNVWYELAVGCIGICLLVVQYFVHKQSLVLGFALLAFACILYLPPLFGIKPPSPDKSERKSLRICKHIVIAILFVGFWVWTNKLDIHDSIFDGIVLFGMGTVMALLSFSGFGNLYELGIAIPAMLCGILAAFFEISLMVWLCIVIAIGGFMTAGIMAYQLKRNVANNDTD